MDMIAELIVGIGRTFKAVREREGLTQQELAAAWGLACSRSSVTSKKTPP